MGSLLGDFVKGQIDAGLAPTLRYGIRLHRKIDAYTDTHPLFRQSKQRLRQPYYRYGGILIDIFYDHFLARRWDVYCDLPL